MEERTHILIERIAPPLVALAAVEAALYVLLDRSDTLHDLYASPAMIVLALGAIGTALRLRARRGGDRRHAAARRHDEERDDGGSSDGAPDADARDTDPHDTDPHDTDPHDVEPLAKR